MGTFAVQSKSISRWIRAGLWALPVSWLVTAWSTLDPQPDQAKDPEAWARFVSSDAYQFSHLFGSTAGTILALFGFFALGCSMANSRTGRLAIASMVTFVGTVLLGIAVWRSHVLPRWAGALLAAGAVVFYVLGVVLGQATAGSSLPSQAAGAVLMAGAGGWIAWRGSRQATTAPDRIG